MKNKTSLALLTLALALALPFAAAADEGSWTGEIIDVACYVNNGAHGGDHSGCAKSCVKNGQPMGLLTEDGDVIILAADHADGAGFEAAKELAGEKAEVSGELSESGGAKVLTVKSAKKAA